MTPLRRLLSGNWAQWKRDPRHRTAQVAGRGHLKGDMQRKSTMTDHDAEEAAARRALEYLFERLAVPMNTASLFAAKLPHGEQREFWSGCCAGLEDARQLIRTVNPAQFRTDRSQSDD